jgi:hypothetical protein
VSDATVNAPILELGLHVAAATNPTFSIFAFYVSGIDIANKTSEVVVFGLASQFQAGQTVVISGVTNYPGFNGTWKIMGATQYGSEVFVVINNNFGANSFSLSVNGTLTVTGDTLKILISTAPKAPVLKLFFSHTLPTVIGTAGVNPPTNKFTFDVGQVFVRTTANFASDVNFRRWATVAYNRQVFFTNDLNPIAFTDGSACFRYSNSQPSARYIDVFFDHLVIGWPSVNGCPAPTRVQWSDLYRINQWRPSPKNEADGYDVEEWCRTDFPLHGCTGLGRVGNMMWVYTPTAIVSMRYQGRMRAPVFGQGLTGSLTGSGGPIMVLGDKVLKDIGNSLMYSLVVYKDMHYFWDGIEQDFYRFNGEQVESIGIRIKQYFLSTVNKNWALFQATWGYARPGRQEIVWVFVSNKQTSVVFDQAIVYNWKTGKWYTQSTENLFCFTGASLPAGRADDLIQPAARLPGTADQMLVASSVAPPMWGTGTGLARESVSSDLDSALLPQDLPTLVTKDYGYDDLEHIKEASSIVLHATDRYANGVNVSLSVRDNLDDPVVYPTLTLYSYDPEEKRFGLPRNAGRLLRYKFQPGTSKGPVREFTWGGFVENVKRKVADA